MLYPDRNFADEPVPAPPPPLDEPNDISPDPHLRKVRERMLTIPIDLPWRYDTTPSPNRPWTLTEHRKGAAGRNISIIGTFATRQEAERASQDLLVSAYSFAANYGGKSIGVEVHDGLTYTYFAFDNPLDLIAFAFKVERESRA